MCKQQGIRLFHIFEDEILFQREIVYEKLISLIKDERQKIISEECETNFNVNREIREKFLLENDINGISKKEKINIGLFKDGEMVSFLSLRQRGDEYYVGRSSDKIGINVENSFKTLIKAFIDKFNPKKIYIYDDLRFEEFTENKTLYLENGFKFQNRLRPQPWYVSRKRGCIDRIFYGNMTKKILKPLIGESYQDWMTDFDMAQILGYDRIWGCGRMVYVYERPMS